MDAKRFDTLVMALSVRHPRRGLLPLLAALPLAGVLTQLLDAETAARRRRHRSHAHRNTGADANRGKVQGNRGKKRKGRGKGKKCKPDSQVRTCAGECGSVPNNCGKVVDCGSCDCGICPTCQTCNAATGRCQTNPVFVGQECALPGQVCRAEGTCACDDASCQDGQRCNGIVCVCDATSCPGGCCDETRTCRINDDDACPGPGGTCQPCPGVCRGGNCESCTTIGAGSPCQTGKCCVNPGPVNGTCVEVCPDCQSCDDDGACVADADQTGNDCRLANGGKGVCCRGICCSGCCDENDECGACIGFVTSTQYDGNLGGLIGANAKCQERAEAGSLPGTYKAWLSNSVQSPSTRFRCTAATCSSEGYVRVDGATIANDWTDLTDGNLAPPLSVTEFNQQLTVSVWTNTLTNGTPGGVFADTHCGEWRNNNPNPPPTVLGNAGISDDTTGGWTEFGILACDDAASLYCFQQS